MFTKVKHQIKGSFPIGTFVSIVQNNRLDRGYFQMLNCNTYLQISIRFTTLSCFNLCNILISRKAVIGNPSFSFSIKTFFRATTCFDTRCLALNTSPKVPCPILVIRSYLETSSQNGNSESALEGSESLEEKLDVLGRIRKSQRRNSFRYLRGLLHDYL